MKIAICVNGESFKFEKGYYWLKQKFLSKYDCDIYIHTWNNSENLDKILDLYQPKDYYFQFPIPFDDNDLELNTILNKSYSSHACFNLVKDSEIKYDYVINIEFNTTEITLENYNKFAFMSLPIAEKYFDCFSFILYYNFVDKDFKTWDSKEDNKLKSFIKYHLFQHELSLDTFQISLL